MKISFSQTPLHISSAQSHVAAQNMYFKGVMKSHST